MPRNVNYKSDLLDDLRDSREYAAAYLSAAKADSNEAFLVALRDVAEARMGMKKVAKEAKVNRENLYRALSREGNPSIATLDSVLEVLGIEVQFVARRATSVSPDKNNSDPTSATLNIVTTLVTTFTGYNTLTSETPENSQNDFSKVTVPMLLQAESTREMTIGIGGE
jgi:probable addiction module antidote protein